jgi:hypothetical protein
MPPIHELRDYFVARCPGGSERDCWPWTGPKQNTGYGIACIGGRRLQATHISLTLDGRPRPIGLLALHSCDNPICVNPHHLRWGTVKENAADMVSRGRAVGRDRHWTNLQPHRRARGDTHGARVKPEKVLRGSANGGSKLTEADVLAIRADTRAGIDVARDYGVTGTTISKIRQHQAWRHV